MALNPGRVTFDLLTQENARFTERDLGGRYALVYFGFLHCRVVCPRSLAKIRQVLDLLGPAAKRLQTLYITVDPERDTPAAMKTFIDGFDSRLTGLSGSRDAIDAAKSAFRVFSRRGPDPQDPAGYATPHTAFIYLLDPLACYVKHFTEAHGAESIADEVAQVIRSAE